MRRELFIAIILCSLIVSFRFSTGGVHAEESTPYIFYYANALDAMVIEKADGSDSRIVAENIQRSYHSSFDWSPSGEWVTWRGWDYGSSDLQFIARTDGTSSFHLPESIGFAYQTQWSHNSDVLLVVYADPAFNSTDNNGIMIFDPENNEVLFDLAFEPEDLESTIYIKTLEYQLFGESPPQDYWSDDDSTVVIYSPTSFERRVYRISMDGTIETFSPHGLFWSWTGQGRLLHQDNSNTAPYLEDLFTGESLVLPELLNQNVVVRSSWNQDASYGVLFLNPDTALPDNPFEPQTWLVNWEAATVIRLPEYYRTVHTWSPDGQTVLLKDAEDAISVLTVTQEQVMPFVTELHIPDQEWYSLPLLFWIDQTIFALYEEDHHHLVRFDVSSNRLIEATSIPFPVPRLNEIRNWEIVHFSPQLTYVAPYAQELMWDNLSTGEMLVFEAIDPSLDYYYAHWSPDENWLFIREAKEVEGINIEVDSIRTIDDTFIRELGRSASGVFVPEHVIPHLAPGQTTSVFDGE